MGGACEVQEGKVGGGGGGKAGRGEGGREGVEAGGGFL